MTVYSTTVLLLILSPHALLPFARNIEASIIANIVPGFLIIPIYAIKAPTTLF